MVKAAASAAALETAGPSKLRDYYMLMKPGIVYSNALAAAAGFLFAAGRHIHFGTFIALLFGTAFVVSSACVFNNFLDHGIDSKMARTKKRALVRGSISRGSSLIYGSLLGALGLLILAIFTNSLTLVTALAGMVLYVVVYGAAKRTTVHSTLIGSLSGSTPPLIGYAAAANRLDLTALLLFLILAAWQMPHFYAIAMFRRDDYAAAGLPIWSVKKGMASTKRQIIAYIVLFIIACVSLRIFSGADWTFTAVMVGLGLYWLGLGLRGYRTKDDVRWARQMFGLSLVTLLVLCATLSISAWLP